MYLVLPKVRMYLVLPKVPPNLSPKSTLFCITLPFMTYSKPITATIAIPDNVVMAHTNTQLEFSGPLGRTVLDLAQLDRRGLAGFRLDPATSSLQICTPSKSFLGLFNGLVQNRIQGVTRGFLVYLELRGIGYRAILGTPQSGQKESDTLILKCGYSHDIVYRIPPAVRIFCLDPTHLCVFGIEKNQVTQIAAKLRDLRRPDQYKGKGIRLAGEQVRVKAGKRKSS